MTFDEWSNSLESESSKPEVKAEAKKQKARERSKAWTLANPERAKAYAKNYRKNQRKKLSGYEKRWRLMNRYGITVEEYDQMLLGQENLCAICKRGLNGLKTCVDHCHKTGVVRGLLCNDCNTAIGKLLGDPEILRRAASYIEQNRIGVSA